MSDQREVGWGGNAVRVGTFQPTTAMFVSKYPRSVESSWLHLTKMEKESERGGEGNSLGSCPCHAWQSSHVIL